MIQAQVNYYNALQQPDKQIIQIAALHANGITAFELQKYLLPSVIDQNIIADAMEAAVENGLFTSVNIANPYYYVDVDFMVEIIPDFTGFDEVWNKMLKDEYFQWGKNDKTAFRNCIYSLLYHPKKYAEHERFFRQSYQPTMYSRYELLVMNPKYEQFLSGISQEVVFEVLQKMADSQPDNLMPVAVTRQIIRKTLAACKIDEQSLLNLLDQKYFLLHGDYEKAIEYSDEEQALEITAYAAITAGDVQEALNLFRQALTIRNKDLRHKLLLPVHSCYSMLYYLAALFSIDSQTALPVFRKIHQWMISGKTKYSTAVMTDFSPVIYFAVNDKRELYEQTIKTMTELISKHDINVSVLSYIVIIYLSGEKPSCDKERLTDIARKACDSDCRILAYEALYVMKQVVDSPVIDKLFNQLAEELGYEPVLSKIIRQASWEKSLNMLMGVKNDGVRENIEQNIRMAYIFKPKEGVIVPVVQKRQTKGWSILKYIKIDSFRNADIEGMSVQDIRIAGKMKKVAYSHSGDGQNYQFTEEVFTALVGHPYVFRIDEQKVESQVEFVAAQPVVSVRKSGKGYSISTNLRRSDKSVYVEKETPNRYRVYDLSRRQQQILAIINAQSIIVPPEGKDKLAELLGMFSVEGITVRSTLKASYKL
ncbi:MAG: hypothetical protein LBS80_04680 [Tannerella sp.]|jgi:tetratricopeptide (TPR) repeat protein|nr:hypothetical protein [Tannerella sp.]